MKPETAVRDGGAINAWFATFEREIDAATAERAAGLYREQHQAHRSLVPGAIELLEALRGRCRLGVVTNNSAAEQMEKLRALDIASYFDTVVISEDVGVTKPDPKIFAIALERIGADARDAVFIGDNWTNDIAGALAAGIAAIWLDRDSKTQAPARLAGQKRLENRAQPHPRPLQGAQSTALDCRFAGGAHARRNPCSALSPAGRGEQNVPFSRLAGEGLGMRAAGVMPSRIATIDSLAPAAPVIAAIKTVFTHRTPGAEKHEQLETLAPCLR